jgi:hypothetical protein
MSSSIDSQHHIHRHADEHGWRATCSSCGWSVTRRTRELRDQDIDAHELGNAVAQSEEVTECDSTTSTSTTTLLPKSNVEHPT